MDFLELLILAAFFLFPLLGRLFGGKPQEPLPSPEEEEWEPEELEAAARAPVERPQVLKAEDVSGWSAEWGDWPGEEKREEKQDEEAQPLEVIFPVEAVSMEPVAPEPVPVRAERPVPAAVPRTLEALRVDRKAEHARFHERVQVAPAPRARRAGGIPALLRDPRHLRQAVILAEVLGPPRALQPLADRG